MDTGVKLIFSWKKRFGAKGSGKWFWEEKPSKGKINTKQILMAGTPPETSMEAF